MTRVLICWCAGLLVLLTIATFAVLIPSLINSHNDGALIAAALLAGMILTADFLAWKALSPLWDE
ncbi:MAG: hypothetical protein J7517_16590 [Sphingobium yanoikuyae]|nr:hypothetical protein [Sphingobium yanoikuyae]